MVILILILVSKHRLYINLILFLFYINFNWINQKESNGTTSNMGNISTFVVHYNRDPSTTLNLDFKSSCVAFRHFRTNYKLLQITPYVFALLFWFIK